MRRIAFCAFAMFWLAATAHADVLKMKSGEYKRGKILKETDGTLMLDSENDGAVVEVRKSDISILERDPQNEHAGGLNFVSVVEKKKEPGPAFSFFKPKAKSGAPSSLGAGLKGEDQNAMVDKLENLFHEWLAKNPQMKSWYDDMAKNFDAKSKELDKVAEIARKSSSS